MESIRNLCLAGFAAFAMQGACLAAESPSARLADDSDGRDWAAFGRTFGEQHYSPLKKINDKNAGKLGLIWSLDLPPGNSVSGPIAVDGTIYTATGYSVVRAIDAATGKLLWTYDPKAAVASGIKIRSSWGIRGLAWWNGKVIVGTVDGRLIAIDAKTGQPVWSVMTVTQDKNDVRAITGAPRVFDGKVIVGHSGADTGAIRAYVTTYDAETGKQLWRFYVVPGNPADGFENKAMEMAAKTWSGQWWRFGGGGSAWNAMTYDAEFDTVYIGTGNGAPWSHKVRSEGKGDNLFLCSIIALDAKTGEYKWHYQFNPGETWDYNAVMDMELAELTIDGKPRKVVMTAPKNGFFYVLDRTNGKLVSAEPIAKVTWATKIDLATGRPVEVPGARFPDKKSFTLWPSYNGAHNWLPMAFSPKTKLVYIPVTDMPMDEKEAGVDPKTWSQRPGNVFNATILPSFANVKDPTSRLVAWDPVTQKEMWRVPTPSFWAGGVMATAGNLVFQGQVDGQFNAYAADTGARLWSFATQAPALGPPITYKVKGTQYVTVLTGASTNGSMFGEWLQRYNIDYHTLGRRVLTFALGGTATLPKAEVVELQPMDDPDYKSQPALEKRGDTLFHTSCLGCHGVAAVPAGHAPDLRASPIPASKDAFETVVRGGVLLERGMPAYSELKDSELEALRQYLRSRAADMRKAKTQ